MQGITGSVEFWERFRKRIGEVANSLRREVPALLAPLILTALYTLNREDIGFDDEASYLAKGLGITPIESFSDGSLYGFFYGVVSLFSNDAVTTYLLGRALVACTFVLGVWLAVRIVGRRGTAWAIASLIALTPVPHVWPGVTLPPAAIMIVTFSLMWRWPRFWALALASATTWIAASMRPEFVWMAFVVSLWVIGLGIWRLRATGNRTSSLVAIATAASIPLILSRIYGPLWESSGRSWVAFSQHFSLRAARPGENPWYESTSVIQRYFPGAESVTTAATSNPSVFFRHTLNNARDLLPELLNFSLGWRPHLISLEGLGQIGVVVLTASALVGLFFILRRQRGSKRATELDLPPMSKAPLLYLALWLGTLTISIIVIFPRHHYLVPLIGLLFLGAGAILSCTGLSQIRKALTSVTVLLLVAATVLTVAEVANRLVPTKQYASAARELSHLSPITLLSGQKGLQSYVMELTMVPGSVPADPLSFREFLHSQKVDAVLVNESLKFGPWSDLSGYGDFILDPAAFGFQRIAPNSEVWIRSSLVQLVEMP